MCLLAPALSVCVGAGTRVSNLAKRLPPMTSEKAEHFHGIQVKLSFNGAIIPRILFSANKIVRAKVRLSFWFL
jgi:hypothetical protein